MSTEDNNYSPGDFSGLTDREFHDTYLVPPNGGAGYDDIFKVSHCTKCKFDHVEVKAGFQQENAQDLNRESCGNVFNRLTLDAGLQGAILVKGGSSDNVWNDVLIRKSGGHTDIMIGGYSGQSKGASKNNRFDRVRRDGGEPVRYAYTFTRAHRPRFTNSNVKFQFWFSLARTIAQEASYFVAWIKKIK